MGMQEVKCFDISAMMSELRKENSTGYKAITAIDVSGSLDSEQIGEILNCKPIQELSKKFKFASMCKILSPRFLAEICVDMFYFRQNESKKSKLQIVNQKLTSDVDENLTETLFELSKSLIENTSDASNEELIFEDIKENTAIITKGQYKQDKSQINILALNKLCKSVSTNYPQTLILLDPFNEIDFESERHKLIFNHAAKFNLEVKVFNIETELDNAKCAQSDTEFFFKLTAPPAEMLFQKAKSEETEGEVEAETDKEN